MSEEKKDQEAVQPPLEAEKEEKAERPGKIGKAVKEDHIGKAVKVEEPDQAEKAVQVKETDQAETDITVKEAGHNDNEIAAASRKVEEPSAAQEGKEAELAEAVAPKPEDAEPPAPADKAKRAPLSEEEKADRLKAAEERRAAKAKAAAEGGADPAGAAGERPARAAAAAVGDKPERPARAPRAKASEEPPKPKEPSPKQPVLDGLVTLLKAEVAEDAVEEAVINEENGHLPTITVKNEHWLACASLLRHHPEWSCSYLRNLAGVDHETHLEVVYYFINLSTKAEAAVHVKTDREQPSIASVTPIWPTANWCEREVYDLLGIDFPGHPDLRRIMMPDDWVGHPLRKDYEPLDSEV
ncbi:NuoC [Paenibacillus thiaminolyticus]|uniref:NADH-quinone oxidoreductase subunit C n=1 Tax=Paenibacillus thiaminolyticus TaxID=49283 RepID=UPI0011637E76|nr:NuoC [Paenibacillus thiaminolyticus]